MQNYNQIHIHMMPDSSNHYFTKLDSVHKYNTKQKQRNEFFQFRFPLIMGEKLYIISV